MDIQNVITFALGTAIAALGWFAREMWSAVKELKDDLALLREELPKEYVTKTDMENTFKRIDSKLDRIFDKLDGKADKRCADC